MEGAEAVLGSLTEGFVCLSIEVGGAGSVVFPGLTLCPV